MCRRLPDFYRTSVSAGQKPHPNQSTTINVFPVPATDLKGMEGKNQVVYTWCYINSLRSHFRQVFKSVISPTSVSWKMRILRGRMHSGVPVKWCLGEARPHSLLLLAHSHILTSKAMKGFAIWMCYRITIFVCSLGLPLSHIIAVMALRLRQKSPKQGFSVLHYFVTDY